jgi:putative hemolysin
MQTLDVTLLALLPALLLCSAFFSGSETALFGMSETERMRLRRRGTFAARAVESLLRDPQMLLITVLLGNMAVNVFYFVISSVLMMRAEAGMLGSAAVALATLLAIVLLGEVLPKMAANAQRERYASLAGPILLTVHNVIAPLRAALARVVVNPLSRLTAPQKAPPLLTAEELQTLLELSSRQGVIDPEEQRVLRDVFSLGRMRVRDVMTPRVRMAAVPADAGPDDVRRLASETRHRRLPVYRGDLDHIIGMLDVKRYLVRVEGGGVSLRRAMRRARFVPQIATLDQLLEHFRTTHTSTAIVVDEFGGTAGIVAIEDVVERLVGDIAGAEREEIRAPRQIGPQQWELDGELSVHDWAEAFGQRLISPRVSTLGGLIVERLGRAPQVGDGVIVGNVMLKVTEVEGARVATAAVTLLTEGARP